MATRNVTVTTSWTLVVDDASSGFVAQSPAVGYIEWATTDSTTPPSDTLVGIRLPASQLVGRGIFGPGYVWARAIPPLTDDIISVTR